MLKYRFEKTVQPSRGLHRIAPAKWLQHYFTLLINGLSCEVHQSHNPGPRANNIEGTASGTVVQAKLEPMNKGSAAPSLRWLQSI